jgi:3-dehydroquinate synthase
MQEITVPLGARSYPINLGSGIADRLPEALIDRFPHSRFALVTNTTLLSLYSGRIEAWSRHLRLTIHAVPDGEQHKSIETWKSILDALVAARLERTAVILAFGGGVVGDMTGFAASSYLRGVNYVQVPTTLLAMVDSSVGGKTGVNHPAGKNLIGAFHQPCLVWVDTDFLSTLPPREFLAGYAELFKYAFIGGRDMFDFIRSFHARLIQRETGPLHDGISRAIAIKARIVGADERESGSRALLNFGHTFAHAIEKYFNYESVLHGEAVVWGIVCAIDLGRRLGALPSGSLPLYELMLRLLKPSPLPQAPDAGRLYEAMFTDKKVSKGRLRFVVPTEPGSSVVRDDVSPETVLATLLQVFGA